MKKFIIGTVLLLLSGSTFAAKVNTENGWKVQGEVVEYECSYSSEFKNPERKILVMEGFVDNIKEIPQEVVLYFNNKSYTLKLNKCSVEI